MVNFTGTDIVAGGVSCADMSEMVDSTTAARRWDTPGEYSETSGLFGNTPQNDRLHGRQEETAKMKKCFMDVVADGTARLLFVAGVSGSGKSCLVEQMRDFVTSPEHHGFFCEGKFEQSLLGGGGGTYEPFGALITAFSDVIDFILNQEPDMLQERSQAVSKALGPDVPTLVDCVPNLSLLLAAAIKPENRMPSNYSGAQGREGATTKTSTHLAILFRNFLHSLTSEGAPILLFLDDLQFADEDSLKVFRALVTDTSLKHVLIVGSYRSNEANAEELLEPFDGASKKKSSTLSTTTIHVGDLSLVAINAGLAKKLGLDEATTQPLSEIVLQKSGGNPFYVTQYLTILQEKQLLVFCYDTKRWTWDADEILMMTDISNNVLELVSLRLKELPDGVRALLTLISFIGFRFVLELVEIIVRQLSSTKSSTSHELENRDVIEKAVSLLRESTCLNENIAAIEETLQKAVHDGLIEKCSDTIFKFTHDRIQQALYEMVKTESARSELHYYIGHSVSSLEIDNNEVTRRANLFFVTDQLNRGVSHITHEEEIIKLAERNLIVGKTAAAQAAYQSAASYMRGGMDLLGDVQYWSTHYSLMIDLVSSTAEIEAKMSNFERSRELCEVVLQRALSLDDKVRSYVCLVAVYCIQESLDDAVRVGMDFLSQMGIHFPRNPNIVHVMLNLMETKRCMYNVSNSMILELPMMSDNKMAKVIEVLNLLATAYYIMADTGNVFLIIVMRVVQLTRRFGLAETTAHGFAIYGLLNSSLGNGKQALRYGNLALAMMESQAQQGNKIIEARVITLVYNFVKWWEMPLQECPKQFFRAVTIGKHQGDLDWAYFSGCGAIMSMFHSGYHLHEALDVARRLCSEMIEYEVHSAAHMALPILQMIENLTGHGDNTYKLTGQAMDGQEMVQTAEQNKNLLALAVFHFSSLCIAVIFQKWDLASELAPSVVNQFKFLDCQFQAFVMRLYLGLTYSESYLRHGRRRDLRKLRQVFRKLKHLENAGVKDCKPLHLILQAELAAATCSGKAAQTEAVKVMYVKAIEECYVRNLIHYRAIANERALRFSQLHQDPKAAMEFLTDAQLCFRDWGADAKVEQMEEMSLLPMG